MTIIDYSQLSHLWKIAVTSVLTLMSAAGIVPLVVQKNAAGVAIRHEFSNGNSDQSGSLLVKSGALAITLRPNGDGTFQGTLTGNHLYAGTFSGANLIDCNSTTGKLTWSSATRTFVCGTDQTGGSGTFGSGNVVTLGDRRYVSKQGDTMTGALTINLTTGYLGLKVMQTASGSVFHAEQALTTSGALSVTGNATIRGTTSGSFLKLSGSGTNYILGKVGIGVTIPFAPLHIFVNTFNSQQPTGINNAVTDPHTAIFLGTAGIGRKVGIQFGGAGGTASNWGIGGIYGLETSNANKTAGDITFDFRKLTTDNALTEVMRIQNTGNVGIGTATPKSVLSVVGSGAFTGTLSGSALNIQGGTSYVLGNLGVGMTSPTKQLDVNGSARIGQNTSGIVPLTLYARSNGGTTNNVTLLKLDQINNPSAPGMTVGMQFVGRDTANATYTGAVIRGYYSNIDTVARSMDLQFLTWGGSALNEVMRITGSGTVGIGKTNPSVKLEVEGTISGSLIKQNGAGNNFMRGNLGIGGETAPTAQLEVWGTMSGSGLESLAFYKTCTLKTSSTGMVLCGSDNNTTYQAGQGLTLNGTFFSLNTSLTGSSLKFQTISGSVIRASNSLNSSGSLTVKGTSTLGTTTVPTVAASDNSTNAATTAYVTTAVANAVAGVNPATAVAAATTAASDTSGLTYANGASGIGATFTGGVNTAVTIDGITFTTLGQRLLVKNDTQSPSGADNGIYSFTQIQTAILPPIFTRASDYNTASEMNNMGSIPVVGGTLNTDSSWLLTSTITTIGTDALTYTRFTFNPTTVITGGGQGLTRNGNSLVLNAALTGTSLKIFGTMSGSLAVISSSATFAGANITFSNSGSVVFNANNKNVDFEINGTNAGLFYLDASTNQIGINKTDPRTTLDVNGTISGSTLRGSTISGSILRVGSAVSPSCMSFAAFGTGTSMTTGSGKISLPVPFNMSGYTVGNAFITTNQSGVGGTASVQIRDREKGYRKIFSTVVSIDSSETGSNTAATPYVINASNNTVSAYDTLYIDIPAIHSTRAAKGLMGSFCLYHP